MFLLLLTDMYPTLLALHSLLRWLVLAFLLYSIFRASVGLIYNKTFSKTDNAFRHWTATVAHIQLIVGILLYTRSPIAKAFWTTNGSASANRDILFYGIIHISFMLTALVLLTVGSALAKRKSADREKYRTILVWFTVALIIILLAIPWPNSPLSYGRPYFRPL